MRHPRLLTACLAALLAAAPCRGADSAGSQPFEFLFLDANARAVALGGAYTALAVDENALLYNPAGLGRIRSYGATFMHNQSYTGITQEYVAFAAPRGFGASLNILDSGPVPQATISNPDGTGLGTTGLTDMALSAGYGRAVTESLHLGAGVKYIRESIDGTSAAGLALDLGGLYEVGQVPGLTLGLALQNLGPTVRFQSAREGLPLNLRAGGAYGFWAWGREHAVALDLSKQSSQGAVWALGAETKALAPLAVRLGFSSRNDAGLGLTTGFGYLFRSGSVDYAFVPMGDLGNAHRISVTFRWGAGA